MKALAKLLSKHWLNLAVVSGAIAAFAVAGKTLVERSQYVIADEAVVNAPVVNINAPIAGQLTQLSVKVGDFVRKDQVLGQIVNSRLQRSEIARITTTIAEIEAAIAQRQSVQQERRGLLTRYLQASGQQQHLEVTQATARLESATSELFTLQAQLDLAEDTLARRQKLATQGAIPQQQLTEAELSVTAAVAAVAQQQQLVAAASEDLLAAKQGLSLSRTPSDQDARQKLEATRLAIAQTDRELIQLRSQLAATRSELQLAQTDFNLLAKTEIRAPVAGAIWQVTAGAGEDVAAKTQLLQIVDCQNRRVDALVNEGAIALVRMGAIAQVKLFPGLNFTGKVTAIRGGVGRVQVGERELVPVPTNLTRLVQVQIDAKAAPLGGGAEFCYVGATGKVQIQRR